MKIEYRKKFLKELAAIHPKVRLNIEKFVFEELPSHKTIFQSGKIEKRRDIRLITKFALGNIVSV